MKKAFVCLGTLLCLVILAALPVYAESENMIRNKDKSVVGNEYSTLPSSEELLVLSLFMEEREVGGEIAAEILYNHEQQPLFIIGVTNKGYLIMDRKSFICWEWGKGGNPFGEMSNVKKYYGGILCYSVERENGYENIVTKKSSNKVSYLPRLEELLKNEPSVCAEQIIARYSLISEPTRTTSTKIENSFSYIQRLAFGKNVIGTCAAVASGIVLTYLDNQVSTVFVPFNMHAEQLAGTEVGNNYSKAEALHQHLIDGGMSAGSNTTQIINIINNVYAKSDDYIMNMELSATSITPWLTLDSKIIEQIDSNKPVLILTQNHWVYGNHAMVVYGYSVSSTGHYEYLVHTGWDGPDYISHVINGYASNEVWVNINVAWSAIAFNYTSTPLNMAAVPTLTVTATYPNTNMLTWTAVTGAKYYTLERATELGGPYSTHKTNVTSTTLYDIGLQAGQTYYYRVKGCKKVDNVELSSWFSPVNTSYVPPTPHATVMSYNTIQVSWNAVPMANAYYLFRSTNPQGYYEPINVGTSPYETSYVDKDLEQDTTYYYKLQITNNSNGYYYSSNYSAIRTAKTWILGDANCDDRVSATDAVAVLRYLVNLGTLNSQGMKNADANVDGRISAPDASAILRYLVQLDTLPPGSSRAPATPPRSGGLPEYTLLGTPSLVTVNGAQQLQYDIYLDDASSIRLSALQFKVNWDASKLTLASASSITNNGQYEEKESSSDSGSYIMATAFGFGRVLTNNGWVASLRFTVNNGVNPQDVLQLTFSNADLSLVDLSIAQNIIDPATYDFKTKNAFFYPNATWAQTYSLVTDVSQVVGGKYVVVGTVQGGANRFAMNNYMTFGQMGTSNITIVGDQVIVPPVNTTWLLQEQSVPRRFSIRHTQTNKYLNIANNTVEGFTQTNTPEYFFDLTNKAGDPSDARLATTALGNRCISIYQTDFRSYTPANCRRLQLYREDAAPGQPTHTPMPTAPPLPTPTPIPPNDVYQRIYYAHQITDGEYLLVGDNNGTKYALNNTLSGGRMGATQVKETDEEIRTTDPGLIWTFQGTGTTGYFTIRSNDTHGKYLNIEGNNTGGFTLTNAPVGSFQISVAPGNNECFYLKTTATGNRLISIYLVDFRSYLPADYRPLYLYKKVV